MFSQERRDKIMELLHQNGRVLAKELAEMFEVSIDSIRRDLSIMEQEHLLKRTHGGAIPLPHVRSMPSHSSVRYGEGNAYQHAIAKLAASYIRENETVFIGGASTHYVMLQYLPKHFPFTVVTNSLRIGDGLKDADNIETYLIGGKIKASGNMTDAVATAWAREFTIALCFVAGGGFSVKGVSTATPEVAMFSRTIIGNSRRAIGLAGHSKFGVDCFANIVPLSALELIITDEDTPQEDIAKAEAAGVRVVVATGQ